MFKFKLFRLNKYTSPKISVMNVSKVDDIVFLADQKT